MRNLLIIFVVVSSFVFMPMTGMAGTGQIDSTTANEAKTIDFQVSNNVTVMYNSVAAEFAAIASHLQGNACYGGGSDTALVFKNTAIKTKGTAYTTDVTDSNATALFGTAGNPTSGWSAM
jgi:calcineurin-like phosphoesterase